MLLASKPAPLADGKDSCPVASYVLSILESESDENNQHTNQLCEDALCKQINREITYEEAADVLKRNGHSLTPATLVDKILNAYDNHQPDKQDQEKGNFNKRCRMWSPEEDILLLAAIHKFGLGDWKSISMFVGGGRSRSQCSQRWGRALDPRITKVAWDPEEEQTLCNLVSELGEHKWATVAKKLGTRSDVQCRYRYYQIVKRRNIIHKTPTLIRQAYTLNGHGSSASSSPPPQKLNGYFQLPTATTKPVHVLPQLESDFFDYGSQTCPKFLSPQELVKSLFTRDLFNCPVEQLIPPLKPRPKKPSEPSSPLGSLYNLSYVC